MVPARFMLLFPGEMFWVRFYFCFLCLLSSCLAPPTSHVSHRQKCWALYSVN